MVHRLELSNDFMKNKNTRQSQSYTATVHSTNQALDGFSSAVEAFSFQTNNQITMKTSTSLIDSVDYIPG
jgi:hypothetical protein